MALPRDLTAGPSNPAGAPGQLQLGELSLTGRSQAGEESWLRLHPPGIAFDVGRGAPELEGCARLFLSHGHLDHALGLPYLLSRRAASGAGETRVYGPAPLAPRLREFVRAAEELEERRYDWLLEGLRPGDRVEVDERHAVEAFAVDHGVPSLGYLLLRRRKRLRAQHRGKGEDEIRRRRGAASQEGAMDELEEVVEGPWLAYCGDSGPGVFEMEPRVFTVPIVVLECTFLAAAHRQRAARYRHLHFEDIAGRAAQFRNEAIVLVHLSRRHRLSELRRRIAELPAHLAERVHVFPGAA